MCEDSFNIVAQNLTKSNMSHFQQHVNTTFSRYYIGGGQYERDWHNGKWRNICYVQSPTGLIALHLEDEDTQEQQLVYTYTDYQGSILALADADGTILEAFSYDPWGNRRTPDSWTNIYTNAETHYTYADPNALWGNFYRGYTGHEHLDVFGIINMNGRLYDPLVARMLSPDNFVQNPSYSQNFNRYSYVYNNPLHYTDPSGEWIWAIPAVVGFGVGYISTGVKTGDWGRAAFGQGLLTAGVAVLGFYSGGATSAAKVAATFTSVSKGHAATVGLGYSAKFAGSSLLSSTFPSVHFPVGNNFGISISPAVIFGSNQAGFSTSVSLFAKSGNWYVFGGLGLNSMQKDFGHNAFYGGTKLNYGLGFNDGKTGVATHRMHYSSLHTSQTLFGVNLSLNKFSLVYQNDWPFGDHGDRFRTAALRLSYGKASVGFNLFTGDPGLQKESRFVKEGYYQSNRNGNNPDEFRAGILYLGFESYQYGVNSESVRAFIQNDVVHRLTRDPYFNVLEMRPQAFFRVGNSNSFSLW